jgi:pyruvate dehydrogenase E1 component beta subunit
MGMGVGAAMTGLRPIVEGMNMGFLLLAFNQISNNCGMLHYTSGGQYKTPIVIRGPGGVGRQLGAEHSQRLESYFQSIPGVQLVAVSTVKNSKALIKAVGDRQSSVLYKFWLILHQTGQHTCSATLQRQADSNAGSSGQRVQGVTHCDNWVVQP